MFTQAERKRQNGADNKSARQAPDRAMRDDLRALAENNRPERTLPELPARGNQPAERGYAAWTGGAPSSGSGLASPLTEIGDGASHSSREYYEDQVVYFYSSDYLLAVEIKPLKTLRMVDADGSAATLEFKLPPPSEAT